jgi:hypothetical protein
LPTEKWLFLARTNATGLAVPLMEMTNAAQADVYTLRQANTRMALSFPQVIGFS